MGSRGGPKISNAGGGGGGPSHEDAEQEAAERNLIRRCIDYHGPATLDVQDRLYRKACRKHHQRPYLQYHSTYIRLMGMPIASIADPHPRDYLLTYCAHITKAKNSSPIVCLSWTPGGRRLLTGNNEGEFTLWDGST
jgi:polyadenylation factor subunit 2